MVKSLVDATDPRFEKAIEHLVQDLSTLRTGRATTALVDSLTVESYGQTMALKQIATLSTPDAHTIAITPWDPSTLSSIEKAIQENQALGLNPSNDGHTIRLSIPPLSEERRREIVKQLGQKVEQCYISFRNIRHDVLSEVRKLEKDKQLSQDDVKHAENELNKKIETYKTKVAEVEKAKEKEILEI